MANEIRTRHTTGSTLYAHVVRCSDGAVWNGSAFEAPVAANWGNYDIALTEASTTGYYRGDMPAAAAGLYDLLVYLQAGGSPATTDTVVSQGSIDWRGNVESTLGGVLTDTEDVQSRLPAALVSGRMDCSVGAMAADTLTASALAASAVSEIQSGLSTLDAAAVRTAVGLASANLDTQLSAIAGYIDTEVAALVAAVGALPTAAQIADKMLVRSLAGGADGGRTVQDALRFLRNRWTRTATALTVYAENDTTEAWTSVLVSSSTANPVTSSDPP